MASDALSVLQASATKTASFNSTGFDLIKGTPLHGLVARVYYSAAANASGSNTVVFSIEESSDNATFYAVASAASSTLTLSTTAQSGEVFIPFISNKRYCRLVCTIAGAGVSPTVTYVGDLAFSRP